MDRALDGEEFRALLERLAAAWAATDADRAAACFTAEATYMEPPDRQMFRGRDELMAYFSPLQQGTYLDIHANWFDPQGQSGAFEFSFGMRGAITADHGVVVVQLRDGLIDAWREYHRAGPAAFDEFIDSTGKVWEWHAGNYP
jgi:hypothetical protein